MTQSKNMKKDETHNDEMNKDTPPSQNGANPLPWIAGALLVLGLAVVGGFYWSSTMTVTNVRFTGNHFVTQQELQNIEVPTGISPDSMDFAQIMNRFEKLSYVRRADISVQPNGNLLVTIQERQPVAMLADGEQKIYIDQEGIRLPIRLGKTVDVPILYGFRATPMADTLKSESFRKTAQFLTSIRNRPASDATISEVAWTHKEGIIALTNQNGVKLIFGKDDFETRLRNWEAFYGEVIKQKGIETMRSIDLRFQGQIVTRER